MSKLKDMAEHNAFQQIVQSKAVDFLAVEASFDIYATTLVGL